MNQEFERYMTDDLRIKEIRELAPPAHLIHEFPCTDKASATVQLARNAGHSIIHGKDDRMLVIVGPCSIHDLTAAMEYATRLQSLRNQYQSRLEIVMRTYFEYASRLVEVRKRLSPDLEILMRVYFEKPRTTVGWKGLINDPDLDGSYRINHGLRIARSLILDITEMGLPTAVEYLDMITPQYIADLVSWGAIGARTTESQVHRELASGLSCPIGFKNGTDGNTKIAIDAIGAAAHPHCFLSVTKGGISAIVSTTGNDDCHLILRGGKEPNYDAESVRAASEALVKAHHLPYLMIDASHSNSRKICRNQISVVEDIARQVSGGSANIMGVMIESNLVEGRQDIVPGKELVYGQSVTDACLSWEDTVPLLDELAAAVRARRAKNAA